MTRFTVRSLVRPIITIGPEGCAKCGSVVTAGEGAQYIWREKQEPEITRDERTGKFKINPYKMITCWWSELAEYHYVVCSVCHWTTTYPITPNIIGSAFYANG